jgi:glycosyltransferase involved in cell wall biosynthesis
MLSPLPPRLLISVVTVCKDESPERLADTFASLAAQTWPHLEHVVVDGGSGPESLAALRRLIAGSNYVTRLLCEADRGIYDAMNKGVALCRGDLVYFLNVGDRFARPDALALLATALAPPYGFAYGDAFYVSRDGHREDRREHAPAPPATRFGLYRATLCHQSVLCRRELFTRLGPFDQDLAPLGDQDWLLRVLSAGHPAVHAGLAVCDFELGGDYARDLGRLFRARAAFLRRHYPVWQRVLFSLGALAVKTAQRLRAGNLAMPVRLAAALGLRRA